MRSGTHKAAGNNIAIKCEVFIPATNKIARVKSPKHTVIDIFGSNIISAQVKPPAPSTGRQPRKVLALDGSAEK